METRRMEKSHDTDDLLVERFDYLNLTSLQERTMEGGRKPKAYPT